MNKHKAFQDLFIEELGQGLSIEELNKISGGGKTPPEPTTEAVGEEDDPTTLSLGEEDPTTPPAGEEDPSTLALGEE